MIFGKKLYDEIILKYGLKSEKLLVLSGYSSASFLQKVMDDLPKVKVSLIIGMAMQGIRDIDHSKYKEFSADNNTLANVFYRTQGPLDHQKIVCFIKNGEIFKAFAGSANFSENGYFDQVESMASVDDIIGINTLVNDAYQGAESCLTVKKIPLITDGPHYRVQSEKNELFSDPKDKNSLNLSENKDSEENENYEEYNIFGSGEEYSLVLNEEENRQWDITGINALFAGKKQSIDILRTDYTDHVFSKEKVVTLINEKNKNEKFHAKRIGNFKRLLEFQDLDIYSLAFRKLGLTKKQPITTKMLKRIGMEKIVFKKIDENEFIFYFR